MFSRLAHRANKKSGLLRFESLMVIALVFTISFLVTQLGPHFVRVLSDEHRRQLDLIPMTKEQAPKLRKLGPFELMNMIRGSKSDTIVVHLWNSWKSNGTWYFDSLLACGSPTSSRKEIIHICTDMIGVRQRRCSAQLARKCGVRKISYCMRGKASLFDMHNEEVLRSFVGTLCPTISRIDSPMLLVFNRQAQLLYQSRAP